MGLFTAEPESLRIGAFYLTTVAPVYAVYGLGMALYFARQGVGNVLPAVGVNGLRLPLSAGGGIAAVEYFDSGIFGFSLPSHAALLSTVS